MDIEWQEGSVCFAGGGQRDADYLKNIAEWFTVRVRDFQLNTIKQGDYIESSELDTEQKYNNAVEVFGLFGFEVWEGNSGFLDVKYFKGLAVNSDGEVHNADGSCIRKLTYPQLMAIGELKRLEIERGKKEARECFVDALDETVAHAEKLENKWTDKHYDFNYQLTQEDIEKGHVRIDAYFVNRMWKVNSWDDTGAAFHVLKTLPRIANNKNPLKRELVALKKQVNLLCKMHGVDNANTN